ncbi:uncharacterized protein PG998_012821 [Apiospora kogelbergensis]|uniref:uncharacterized protein n=1 Tax=Apiospora kogelbergensis TaxID=1337665 RepID=UPI0031310ACF
MILKTHRKLTLSNTWTQACGAFCATSLFAAIILLVQSMFNAQERSSQKKTLDSIHKVKASWTLSFARTAQAILSLLTTLALQNTFQYLQWIITSRPQGLPYSSMLALSPTTGGLGMVSLLWSFNVSGSSKAWTIMRYSHNTSNVTIYETALNYNVTAGVGSFNGSYVHPFLDYLKSLAPDYPYTTLPYSYYTLAGSLVTYATLASVADLIYCRGDGCFSYLLSAGLELTLPRVPQGYSDYPLVRVVEIPTVQVEFALLGPHEQNTNHDCTVYGAAETSIGIELCLAQGPPLGGLQATISSCTNGTKLDECLGRKPLPSITYGVEVFSRRATLIVSQSNHSIMAVEDLTEAIALPSIDLVAYKRSLDWLLNFTAANIPAASSVAANFAVGDEYLLDLSTDGVLSRNFQSLLAFPLWFFSDNSWGNAAWQSDTVATTLPPQYHTMASIVVPYSKVGFDRSMFYIFIALQGTALAFIWIVLAWVWLCSTPLPYISSFPLFDTNFKLEMLELSQGQGIVRQADDSHLLELVSQERVHIKRT